MSSLKACISNLKLTKSTKEVSGFLTDIDGESMFCIKNYDSMDPFFMSIVSSCDLWMFISSSGGLTAGRQNYNNAIFPYYTDDKIHETSEVTGPKTIIRIIESDKLVIWEPFSNLYVGLYDVSRNLYKNTEGNKIIFEEVNNDLKLKFSYCWMSSDNLGWVRKCKLTNESGKSIKLDITDGLQNIIPYGITRDTQSLMSTLMDAYKVSEWHPESNLALYRMSSIPVDRAEPSEALRTNCAWVFGLDAKRVLLSSKQIKRLRFGEEITSEHNIFGQKTSIFVYDQFTLKPNETKDWYIVADLAKDSSQIVELKRLISTQKDLKQFIESSVKESSEKLKRLVGLADGIQTSGDKLNDKRHFANTMFNVMRGGIFEKVYDVNVDDFLKHIEQANKEVYGRSKHLFTHLNNSTRIVDLLVIANNSSDKDLLRLTLEYLPISFSRRHGDPSRPWNFFDINLKNADGSPSLSYQGNWRDIFQNWEALAFSFPEYLPGMICRFLNASTADGYNPYRITREGFDWEVPEPHNPWAYIGYWGDHQIIYLLRLLELHEKFFPNQLLERFEQPSFVYANVPYRIKNYNDIIKNPQDTIVFDWDLHEKLMRRSSDIGADGKLMTIEDKGLVRVSFIEKILVSLLTKVSNLVPEAGVWLNTQRPEWNDANNALVGNGTSMVTLYQLRRYVGFFSKIIENSSAPSFQLSSEVNEFFSAIYSSLKDHSGELSNGFTDHTRKKVVDSLGKSGSEYRSKVYNGFKGNSTEINRDELQNLFGLILAYIDQSIKANKRSDGLYHSYNLIEFNEDSVHVHNLQLMLEGQAAVLGSGWLNLKETSMLMDSLFRSELWREDQKSFILYPFKQLPSFLNNNVIPKELVEKSSLLKKLLEIGNTQIIKKDVEGNYHFNATFKNVGLLKESLCKLNTEVDNSLVESEEKLLCDIYEKVFQHRYFTGRSGSFYKYEGLGSIYWHLVSKLLLTIGENIIELAVQGRSKEELSKLIDYYYKVKEGIGAHKSPQVYGAFSTDPYSHTPSMMGAQQPGMTGQVKEDFLSRFNELGLLVEHGEITILPVMLTDDDLMKDTQDSLNFTFCGTPVTYKKGEHNLIEVHWDSDSVKPKHLNTNKIPNGISQEIFSRTNRIARIVVHI
jgi:hypothetical protein